MRRNHFIIVGSGLTVAGALISMSGCSSEIGTEPHPCKGAECESSSTGSTTTSSGSGGGGGGPTEPMKPTCDGNPDDIDPATKQPKVFNADCSVFALFGAMGSSPDGTMKNPYPSLQQAIDKSNGRWIIACNKATFVENVTTTNNVQVYGGFACPDLTQPWKRDSTVKTKLDAEKPDTIALTLRNNPKAEVNVKFQDFAINALDAAAPGGSSIAVAVDDKVFGELVRCAVTARKGQPGEDAKVPTVEVLDGLKPTTPGTPACFSTIKGGPGAVKTCPDGQSFGGDGGNGGVLGTSTGKGQPGKNGDNATASNGTGGKGEADASGCSVGQEGAKGTAGAPGKGGIEIGSLSLTGITGGDGTAGGDGTRGHGGGGGGGRIHGVFCGSPVVEGPGASGGGGGSGACGGKGGSGGKAGGSSIGIISLGPNLKFTDVAVTTGISGKGGNGLNGRAGGTGGFGGPGGSKPPNPGGLAGCDGGKGGDGGDGGPGGGGRGGHSIGVLYKVTPTMSSSIEMPTQGAAGPGGTGSGVPPNVAPPGSPGTQAVCWDLSKKMPCSP